MNNTMPISQFVVYSVMWKSPISGKTYPWSQVFQTFGEALESCCETSQAKEILSINNNEDCFKDVIHLCFNDSDDEYYITPCLFTFHKELPIIENDDVYQSQQPKNSLYSKDNHSSKDNSSVSSWRSH